jgi:hypothetical protein
MKVFGIGLGRTGTKSLSMALKMLGIKTIHHCVKNEIMKCVRNDFLLELDTLSYYDAMVDGFPVLFYKRLYKRYPDAKFILTTRDDVESWLKSVEKNYRAFVNNDNISKKALEIRRKIFGTDVYDKDILLKKYEDHKKEVLEFFKDKDNLLVLDVDLDDKFDRLKDFLGIEKDTPLYPNFHTTKDVEFSGGDKIFVISPSRSGTRSVTNLLRTMGKRIIHCPKSGEILDCLFGSRKDDHHAILDILWESDGISDTQCACIYPKLRNSYKNAKFILSVRDPNKWLDSVNKWWANVKNKNFERMWRYIIPENTIEAYENYLKKVREDFKDDPNFLEISLEDDNKKIAKQISEFLDIPLGIIDELPEIK